MCPRKFHTAISIRFCQQELVMDGNDVEDAGTPWYVIVFIAWFTVGSIVGLFVFIFTIVIIYLWKTKNPAFMRVVENMQEYIGDVKRRMDSQKEVVSGQDFTDDAFSTGPDSELPDAFVLDDEEEL